MTTGGLIAIFVVVLALLVMLVAMVAFTIKLYKEGKQCESSIEKKYSARSAW